MTARSHLQRQLCILCLEAPYLRDREHTGICHWQGEMFQGCQLMEETRPGSSQARLAWNRVFIALWASEWRIARKGGGRLTVTLLCLDRRGRCCLAGSNSGPLCAPEFLLLLYGQLAASLGGPLQDSSQGYHFLLSLSKTLSH